MTPQGTKELAFEKARQHALKKFGTHVLSDERLASIETPEGIKEVSTKRIVALAAGEARLVDGSKQVKKTVSGEAIIYEVSAAFEIESAGVENALRAYLKRGDDSPLGRSVTDAVELQKKVTRIDPKGSDDESVRRLLSSTEEAYKQVSLAAEKLDGGSVESQLAKRRQKRKTALLRHMQKVKRYGHPQDLLRLSLSQTDLEDNGDEITFTYQVKRSRTKNARKVVASCKQTRPIWAGAQSRDDGVVGRPDTDGWLKQVFEDTYLDFDVELPLLMYMLDDSGNVLLVIAKTSKGMMSSPSLDFNYARCKADRLISDRLWEKEWTVRVPTRYLNRIDRVVLAVSRADYLEVAEKQGFSSVDRGLYERGQGRAVPLKRFLPGREEFEEFINSYARQVKDLPLTGYEKKTEQGGSINDFFDP
jgi:hypothetical protein